MQVVYDISVLGSGMLDPKARTGVFRVVENLALALARSENVDLLLCAGGGSLHPVYGALQFLEQNAQLAHLPFLSGSRRAHVFSAALKVLLASTPHHNPHLAARAVQALRGRMITRVANSPFPVADDVLRGGDVYHSPYAPLPGTGSQGTHPRVITVYDLIGVRWPDLYEEHVEQHDRAILSSIRPTDVVTCISASTRNDLCEHTAIDPQRVFVTQLAASRELFHPENDLAKRADVRSKYGLPDAQYLLALGTLKPVKNFVTTIRAFARLVRQERLEDLHLVLVGVKGWNYSSIFEAVSEASSLAGRIHFTGFVEDQDLASLYSGALAFVFPSLYEGFGLPVLEAMQCGIPVVASNTSSMPEVIGDAGMMLAPTDVDGFASALLEIYRDPALRENLSSRSVARADTFSWDRCAAETVKAYEFAAGQ